MALTLTPDPNLLLLLLRTTGCRPVAQQSYPVGGHETIERNNVSPCEQKTELMKGALYFEAWVQGRMWRLRVQSTRYK
jgi:hypothetical protein